MGPRFRPLRSTLSISSELRLLGASRTRVSRPRARIMVVAQIAGASARRRRGRRRSTGGKATVAKRMTAHEARRAIYFDFEGCVGEAPSILGWSYLREDGTEHFRQWVVERELWPASRVTVPHTGGAQKLTRRTLDAAVRRIVELAEEGDRLLVSWATHDRKIVEQYVTDSDLVERLTARYRNALKTARPWVKVAHPEIELVKGWGGAHKLAVYARIMGIPIPAKYGPGIAASGIRAMRKALAEYGSYAKTPPEARKAWKALLGHNRLDCKVCGEVVRVAAGCGVTPSS